GDATYFVRVTTNGPGVQFFTDGTYKDNFHPVGTPDGTFTEGPNGTVVWTVPRADVGNPPNGLLLSNPHSVDHGAFTAAAEALRYTAFVDRAPDVDAGAPYTL